MNQAQWAQIAEGKGFIAALDQSGGSTPKALDLYGVPPADYQDEEAMFAAMHAMRQRIIMADAFTRENIIGAILFQRTMDATIKGVSVPKLLWEERGVVPFLKIDTGLAERNQDVQLMKPIPDVRSLLTHAASKGIFGTKERSVIHEANEAGIEAVVVQQITLANIVCAMGLVPIVEPEVNIHAQTKAPAEALLKDALIRGLADLEEGRQVMLKLTLPSVAGFYDDLAAHPKVLRIVALSGGYSLQQASALLSKNSAMIASFSRALTEGLKVDMTDQAFAAALRTNVEAIYSASVT
ncbi:MAG: fructose bisphosphate aldolase [Pseudomonadota bacterium]